MSNFLATRRELSGRIGSFEVRELTLEERVRLVKADFATGPDHRGYLIWALGRASNELLGRVEISEILERLADDSEAFSSPIPTIWSMENSHSERA